MTLTTPVELEVQKTHRWAARFGWLILPWLIFVVHGLCFRSWIIDDAGISFVYARNLVAGHGLVSQPGLPPVEGYSNPLWVLMLAPLFALGLFHPILTPKLLSVLLIAGAFFLVHRAIGRMDPGARLAAPIALTFVALNTSFVVWSTSGLENPLYVLLICGLLNCLLATRARPTTAGLMAAAIALTRPEGVLYAALYPLARTLRSARERSRVVEELRGLTVYGVTFGLTAGSYLSFRWLYFGEWMPNTYYAKGGPETTGLLPHAFDLLSGLASHLGVGLVLAITVLSIRLVSLRSYSYGHLVLGLFMLWSGLAHLLLPPDWMGEYRFATPFFVFFYAYTVLIFSTSLRQDHSVPKPLAAALLLFALAAQVALFAPRSARFAQQPTVPFTAVAAGYATQFDEFATRLSVEDGSLLLPDVGGTLYYSKLRIYDLAGLTDAVAARTLGKHPAVFRDYVFDQVQPTFIHLHGYWALRAGFDLDSRFQHDYLPIRGWINKYSNDPSRTVWSGDFVRRDSVSNLAELRLIQEENADPDGLLPAWDPPPDPPDADARRPSASQSSDAGRSLTFRAENSTS